MHLGSLCMFLRLIHVEVWCFGPEYYSSIWIYTTFCLSTSWGTLKLFPVFGYYEIFRKYFCLASQTCSEELSDGTALMEGRKVREFMCLGFGSGEPVWLGEGKAGGVLPPETLTFPTLSLSHLCELMSCFLNINTVSLITVKTKYSLSVKSLVSRMRQNWFYFLTTFGGIPLCDNQAFVSEAEDWRFPLSLAGANDAPGFKKKTKQNLLSLVRGVCLKLNKWFAILYGTIRLLILICFKCTFRAFFF